MSREPHEANGSRDQPRQETENTGVNFYDPTGKDIGSRFVSGKAVKKVKKKKVPPPVEREHAAEPVILDDDHVVLNERIERHAAQSIQEHAEDLGDALLAKFQHILKKQVAESDAPLSDADIASMSEAFRAELETIETVFVKAVEDYTLARERTRQEQSRGQIFHRMLVHNFAHRFADERDLHEHPEMLSRRMLPGFFSMLKLMLGDRRLARFEQDARDIVEKMQEANDGVLDWEAVHRSPEARSLCFRAEVEIAKHFTETEKRLNWMIAMINANLIPAETRLQTGAWVLTLRAAKPMLSELIRNVRAALASDKAKAKMERKLGPDTVTLLDVISRRFA